MSPAKQASGVQRPSEAEAGGMLLGAGLSKDSGGPETYSGRYNIFVSRSGVHRVS